MKKSLIFAGVVAAVSGVGGFVWGQDKPEENDPNWKFANQIATADGELQGGAGEPWDGAKRAVRVYDDSTKDPAQTHHIIEQALVGSYTSQRPNQQTAKLQALACMQNARLIEQNDEIIALLKKQKG